MSGTKESEKQSDEIVLKDCFIITPIGIGGSDTFKKADGLIKSVIDPVLREFGFRALPAYLISAGGSITKQVIEHVINDELVIANLTGLNPNVMYELALRHAYKKKVITMAEKDTKLPFDISDQRTIFYDDNLYGSTVVIPILREYIKDALETEVTSNPVIDSVKEAAVINSAMGAEPDAVKYLLSRFDRLERMLSTRSQTTSVFGGRPLRRAIFKTPSHITESELLNIIQSLARSAGVTILDIDNREGKISIKYHASRELMNVFTGSLMGELKLEEISSGGLL